MIAEIFKWLIASDIIWGALVGLYLIIAIPIGIYIAWRKEKRNKK